MPVSYDLVILGGTAYARGAALRAVGYGARVALVEPPGLFEQRQREQYLLEGLQQVGDILQGRKVGEQFGLTSGGKLAWHRILDWVEISAETQVAHHSVESLSARGIDIVLETPKRLTRQPMVITETRRLSARSILAAYGQLPTVIESLQGAQEIPHSVSIAGGSPEAVEWALALNDCGVQVTLVSDHVLPNEDRDVRRLMRSCLLTSGINICSKDNQCTKDNQCSKDNQQSDHILQIEAAQPVLELPSFISSNTKSLRTKSFRTKSIKTNRRLQTSHPRIFACGSILGGSTDEALAQHEAQVALHNALFLPKTKINYENIPQAYSHFARIGLKESQAQRRYGSAIQTVISSSANATCLNRMSPIPQYCKLICTNKRLVGVHLVGSGAGNVARLLAPNMGQSVQKISIVADGGLSKLFKACVEQLQQNQWTPQTWRRDWAENWFNWRRSQ